MHIQFIENPPFVVDFAEFNEKPPVNHLYSTVRKTMTVAIAIFTSVGQAVYLTIINSPKSFKHVIVNYWTQTLNHGQITEGTLIMLVCVTAYKIFYWMGCMAWCTVTTSFRLFKEKAYPMDPLAILSRYSDEIDMRHIRTNELALDTSDVPEDVKVNDLIRIFDQIDFIEPLDLTFNPPLKNLDYIPPESRREGTTANDVVEYSGQELKEALKNFVNKVDNRVAFVGTPPLYDTPRLLAFYQQIEDAVRISIHQSNQSIAAFETAHGVDRNAYNTEVRNEYSNLLEDRFRIALDLAIAGKHCGSRFMGDSMEIHDYFAKDKSSISGSLEDDLIELLAKSRKEVAKRQIAAIGNNTHIYPDYMTSLGELLAIPGTKNIVEHISNSINKDDSLKNFFTEYNVKHILDTIQAEIQRSNSMRIKVIDWLKEQCKDRNIEAVRIDSPEKINQIKQIIAHPDAYDHSIAEDNEHLLSLCHHLHKENSELPSLNDWNDFLNELFALDQAKEFVANTLQDFSIKELRRLQAIPKKEISEEECKKLQEMARKLQNKIRQIKNSCSEQLLGKTVINVMKDLIGSNIPISQDVFIQRFKRIEKIKKLKKVIALPDNTIERILNGQANLEQVVNDHLDLQRRREFIDQLKVEDIERDGLSKKLMEWMIVSHHILKNQG